MDISNNPNITPDLQRRPVSLATRIVCSIVLLICSFSLPVMTFYINRTGTQQAADYESPLLLGIALCSLALCAAFVLIYCHKPVFLGCAFACFVFLFLFGAWICVLFASLLCAVVAGAALLADVKGKDHLLFALPIPIAYLAAFALTRDPLLALGVLLPAIGAVALAFCFRKKFAIITSVGVLTGSLAVLLVLFFVLDMAVAGIPLNMQGINDLIKAYHATISDAFGQALQLMIESEELATEVASMLGGEISAELIAEFADSVATAMLGMLPGLLVMMLWIFSFVAHRGFTAILLKGQPKEVCPTHMSEYLPSIPTAVLMLLCYVLLIVSAFFANGEVVTFIALNLLFVLMPILLVSGILGIVANVKQARVKWPLLLLYGISVVFLGLAVIPMIAFFGAFGVIMQAIAKALEKKFNDFQGGQ